MFGPGAAQQLKNYAFKKNIKMATLIKELLVAYLDEKESKDQENTNGLDQIDHMEKKMLLNRRWTIHETPIPS